MKLEIIHYTYIDNPPIFRGDGLQAVATLEEAKSIVKDTVSECLNPVCACVYNDKHEAIAAFWVTEGWV